MFATLEAKLIAVAVALGLLVGGALYGKHLYDANAALTVSLQNEQAATKAVQQNLDATNDAYDARDAEIDKLTAALAVKQRSITNALNANTAWRDTAVPDAVFDSLYGPARAATEATPAR